MKLKNKILLLLLVVTTTAIGQQNIQMMSSVKGKPIITLEHFSQDKYGTTYFFTDLELSEPKINQSLSLTKIMRTISIKNNWSAHLEYNGGLFYSPNYSSSIPNAYLVGADYFIHSKDFTKTLNLKASYKYISILNENTFQISGIWNVHLLEKKLSLLGFAHYWRELNNNVFYSEPQIWYNITPKFSIGGEVKTSYNFNQSGINVTPLAGIKIEL